MNDPAAIPMDDIVGPGYYQPGAPPPDETKKVINVTLSFFPNGGSQVKITGTIVAGNDLMIDAVVEGKICSEEEYSAVMNLLAGMV